MTKQIPLKVAPLIDTCYPNQSTKHVTTERLKAPAVDGPSHKCKLPGAWTRWTHHLKAGAIVRCNVCGKRYEYSYYTSGDGFQHISWGVVLTP